MVQPTGLTSIKPRGVGLSSVLRSFLMGHKPRHVCANPLVMPDNGSLPTFRHNLFRSSRGAHTMFSSRPDAGVDAHRIAHSEGAYLSRAGGARRAFHRPAHQSFAQAPAQKPDLIRDHFRDDSGRSGPQLVALKGGEFIMGTRTSDPAYNTRNVQHKVVLSPFAIGQFQITNEEFAHFLKRPAPLSTVRPRRSYRSR